MSQPERKPQEINGNTNDNHWSNRGEYWLKKLNPVPQYKAQKRQRIHRPLILSGHGIRLNVDCGTLLIKCGFTHYPQKREEYRFFPKDRQLPSRIVILDGDGSITFDALEWLSQQGVPLVQIDWKGELSCVGGANYAANFDLVKQQLETQENGQGFEFSKWLILEKIKNSSDTIKHISDNSAEAQPLLAKIKEQADLLKKNPPDNLAALLAVEGVAAATYFRYWYTLSLKWRGLGRKPIPQEWERIGTRIGSTRKSNQYAVHPVNAILNYVYGVLEHQVKGYILAAGVNPTIGYMHSNGNDRASLVFDLMEPIRPVMDRKVLEFVLDRTFSPDDFILNKDGICRLHPQFARYIVKIVQDMPEIEKIMATNLKKLFGRDIYQKPRNYAVF
jgi:CRISPR-associated endonuclease Cas1